MVSRLNVSGTKFKQKLTGPLMVFKVSRTANQLTKMLASLISGLAELCPPLVFQLHLYCTVWCIVKAQCLDLSNVTVCVCLVFMTDTELMFCCCCSLLY